MCQRLPLCILVFIVSLMAGAAEADPDNAIWAVTLDGFFPGESKGGQPKRLNVYLIRRDGKWVNSIGTPTIQGKPVWNTAYMMPDPLGVQYHDGKLGGKFTVTLVPDPWVPSDQKVRVATVALDASVKLEQLEKKFASISGTWEATIPDEGAAIMAEARLQASGKGKVIGSIGPAPVQDVSDVSYDLTLFNLMPGKSNDNFQRRRALSLGVKDSKAVSARFGQMDIRGNAYDYEIQDTPEQMRITPEAISGPVAFSADTLDGERAEFMLELSGRRLDNFAAGTWKGKYTLDDGKSVEIAGYFKGNIRKGAFIGAAAKDDRPWFEPVKEFKAVLGGEHPRLFFRKEDLPELRRRAETPEGKKIVARLRQLLNGSDGESVPIQYNPATKAYEDNKFKAAPGAYSISHGAGFGFLYQLTGDRKFADLARQCVEKAFAGQRNFDDRYAWASPGGELRAGPSVGWTAAAYDLCYDAWDPDFRQKVALAIQNYADGKGGEWNNPEGITLRKMVLTPKQGPGSNHFGAVVGGCGLAVLAIKDDPGMDKELLAKYLDVLERQVARHLSAGWGDGGYYKEGWGASRVGTQGGFLCFLQALKVARSRDYLNVERTNATNVTMIPRCMMVVGPPAVYPYRSNMGPTYGSPEIHRELTGFSSGGYFSEGFGAIADKHKPALLWTYNHSFEPAPETSIFDTHSLYPHRAMLALINWPAFSGIQEQNPGEILPRVSRDTLYDYFVFRNRWHDKDDIVTTVLINVPDGTKPYSVMVWGLGTRNEFGNPPRRAPVTHFQPGNDGSGTLSAGDWSLAVDYSGASGADALLVSVGPDFKPPAKLAEQVQILTLKAGTRDFHVLTLSRGGKHPEASVADDKLTVGKQTVTWSAGKLTLSTFRPNQ